LTQETYPEQKGGMALDVKRTTKPRQRRTKAEQRAESLEQILDAAELLFSKHGFYGVTLRDVAQRVGIHTTLLHYYFKDKTNLFEAVFARRAPVTVGRRRHRVSRSSSTRKRPATNRPSRARYTPSSIPTSTSITRAASTG